MYISDFIRCVEEKVGSKAKKTSKGYSVCCPAHNDTNPSLSINEGADGTILLKCFAGCTLNEICRSVRVESKELSKNNLNIFVSL